jgi:NAD/NADP transhydrogenase beta subunit
LKFAVDMGPDTMIHMPSFVNICLAFEKLTGRIDVQTARILHKHIFIFTLKYVTAIFSLILAIQNSANCEHQVT